MFLTFHISIQFRSSTVYDSSSMLQGMHVATQPVCAPWGKTVNIVLIIKP